MKKILTLSLLALLLTSCSDATQEDIVVDEATSTAGESVELTDDEIDLIEGLFVEEEQ